MERHGEVADCGPAAVGPDRRPLRGPSADADLARLCKAVAHPVRVQILRALTANPSCRYGDLAAEIELAKSTVSQHLKILKQAGLVRGSIDGPRRCYCIEPRELARLQALLHSLQDQEVKS